MIDEKFWKNKKVLITGHTGFKGAWLTLWLRSLGANVTGYALEPPTVPSLYQILKLEELINSEIGDIRDYNHLRSVMQLEKPDIVIHMAAQPIVRESYKNPLETYEINVMGTVHVLEAVRFTPSVRAIVNVTTDKCYENKEWLWGYRENEPLGGYDPYSNSKACSEFVTAAYRDSYFNSQDYEHHGVALASARAGNVIGGGDWAADRLIPDCIKALSNHEKIIIRNPHAIRPWQYVLEPLAGYLLLAQKLYEVGPAFAESWNFGPHDQDAKEVEWIVRKLCDLWGISQGYEVARGIELHEAKYLKLDCTKAKTRIQWQPRWSLEEALVKVVEWTRAYENKADMREICLKQIHNYMMAKREAQGE